MRLASIAGRPHLWGNGWFDLARESAGMFAGDLRTLIEDQRLAELARWAAELDPSAVETVDPADLEDADFGTPIEPRQVLIVGLNYRTHAQEVGLELPRFPYVVGKAVSSIEPPHAELTLPSDRVDAEIEVVAIIGNPAWQLEAGCGLDAVAGLCVGQDFSERRVQIKADAPLLGKSLPGFTRIGPELVTLDELGDPQQLSLVCTVNGATVQTDTTTSMIFSIAEVVEYISRFMRLLPGDAIFTGTPAGVGMAQRPPRYLKPGDELVSRIEGLGEMRQRCVAVERPVDLLSALR